MKEWEGREESEKELASKEEKREKRGDEREQKSMLSVVSQFLAAL